MSVTRGEVIVFVEEHMPPSYVGKRAKVLRVSRITGSLTVELLDQVSEGIKAGHVITVSPYQVRSAMETRP